MDWARKFELVSVIVVALLSPLIAGAGIWYSNNQIREQLKISSEGQITDRYNKAVENLGDDAVDVRLGGIYALQRIMEDSPRDHPTIANVLTTYIRTHTTKPHKKPEEGDEGGVGADVAAALTILAHRDQTHDGTFTLDLRHTHLPNIELPPLSDSHFAHLNDANLEGANLNGADLTNADLFGADLAGANLNHADLFGADLFGAFLNGADLTNANLTGADLTGAHLDDANLNGANLNGANLNHADLTNADLNHADLTNANLEGANLEGANLEGANLTDAWNLTVQQLLSARINQSTKLPARLAKDPAIKAHISDNE